jgi:hypothetical protein
MSKLPSHSCTGCSVMPTIATPIFGCFAITCSRPPSRQKCGMRWNRVAQVAFWGDLCMVNANKPSFGGRPMATIPMIPVGPVTTLNRSIFITERRMSGNGGDDFLCGHCGHVMLEDFDPSTIRGNPVYQCPVCENNNDLPFAASDGRH